MNGKKFSDMKVFAQHQARIRGVVSVPRRSADTFGRDLEQMLGAKQTFEEAIRGRDFSIMGRQRLELVRRDLFQQLDATAFFEEKVAP
jgi:hypothetical protein